MSHQVWNTFSVLNSFKQAVLLKKKKESVLNSFKQVVLLKKKKRETEVKKNIEHYFLNLNRY